MLSNVSFPFSLASLEVRLIHDLLSRSWSVNSPIYTSLLYLFLQHPSSQDQEEHSVQYKMPAFCKPTMVICWLIPSHC